MTTNTLTPSAHTTFRHDPTGATDRTSHTRPSQWTVWMLLALGALLSVAPLLYMVGQSFGTSGEWTTQGWTHVLQAGILRAALNSLILCVLSGLITTLVATFASFAFAKLRFRGSQAVLMTIAVLMLIPGQVYIIPQYFNIARLVGIGNLPMTAVIYSASALPFSIFVMTNFFRTVPDELLEAAIVDGASYLGAMRRIFLPMSGPALITIGVLNFIGCWNDLLTALLYLPQGDQRTISVVLATAESLKVFDVRMAMAGAIISAIPCLVVYLVFERYITVGLTAGIGK